MGDSANRQAFSLFLVVWLLAISIRVYAFPEHRLWIGEITEESIPQDFNPPEKFVFRNPFEKVKEPPPPPVFEKGDLIIVVSKPDRETCLGFGLTRFALGCKVRRSALTRVGMIRRGAENPPEIGSKDFYYVRQRMKFKDASQKAGEEEWYEKGWLLDYTEGQDGGVSLIDIHGRSIPLTTDQLNKSANLLHRVTLRWDTRNNLPATPVVPKDHLVAVVYGEISAFINWKGWVLFLLLWILCSLYTRVSTHHLGNHRLDGVSFTIFSVVLCIVTLLIVAGVGSSYGSYKNEIKWICEDRYDVVNFYVEHRRLDDGKFLPLMSDNLGSLDSPTFPKWEIAKTVGFIMYCVIFPLWFFWHLPGFIRGIHYFAIPHPVEKHIPTVGRDGVPERIDVPSLLADISTPDLSDLPPTWVSSNQKKRLDAAKEVVKAQNELMQEVIRHTKSREYIDDQR